MPKQIIICKRCSGKGEAARIIDSGRNYVIDMCIECQGSGRLMETTTIFYEPYIPDKEKN